MRTRRRAGGRLVLVLVLLMIAALVGVPRTVAWAVTTPTFATHSDLTVGSFGSTPYSVTTGDLRALGRSDIVVLDQGADRVAVFLNNGNGTFAAEVDYALPFSATPFQVVLGDFHGIGKPDIAVADSGTNQVSVFPNNGSGGFGTRADYSVATSGQPEGLAVGDFNGDAHPDLAVADYAIGKVSVLLNSGTGTFPTHTEYSLPVGSAPIGVAVGDFNGDAHPDLAVTDSGTGQVSVLLNSGTGTFPTHAETSLPAGSQPRSIAVGDFTGDAHPDLVTADFGTGQVSVLLNSGTGTFPTHTEYSGPASAQPTWVATGDFNGDGSLDFAISNGSVSSASVFTNNGSGAFTLAGSYTVGTTPYAIAVGDFNNDARPDLVTANEGNGFGGSASVLLNTTPFPSPPTITSANHTTFVNGVAGTFTVTATGLPAPTLSESGTLPTGVTFTASTGVLAGTPSTLGTYTLTITAHNTSTPDATQTFTLTVMAPATFATHVDYATGTAPASQAVGDFNGDGHPDIVTVNSGSNTMSVLMNNGSGTFATKVDYTTGNSPQGVAVGDLMGNGRADIVEVNNTDNTFSVWQNNGSGVFSVYATVSTAAGCAPVRVEVGDFTGDGHPDLALDCNSASTVKVYFNNGTGTFTLSNTYTTGTTPYGMAVADFNGDGHPDIAVADYGTTTVSVLMNNGNGTFATKVDYTTGATPYSVAVGDFNGDGHPDLVVSDHGTTAVSVLVNNGNGTFAAKVDYTVPATPWGVAVGDFNGDGHPDIAVANGTANTVSVLLNNGDGTFAAKVDYATGASATKVAVADFNGDGHPDMVVIDQTAPGVSVLLNTTSTWQPVITSTNATTFSKGQAGTFTVTATGTSTPSLAETGTLPTGVTFTDNGNGTATLAGTTSSTGTYTLTLTATNSTGSTNQTFTLSVLGWYNASWLYRKTITINHAKVGANLTNFPALVSITDANLASNALASGYDILFTSVDGVTKLSHQIETYTPGTGTLVAWVNVPALSNTVDTVIYMYYGNAAATNQQNATGVWDANYKAVWHLSESPTATAPQFKDSTGNADNATAQGSMLAGAQVPGKIDGSITLDGVATYASTATQSTVPNTDTVEVWFKTTTASGKKILGFEDTQTGTTETNYDRMLWVGTDGLLRFGMYDGAIEVAASSSTVTDNAWHLAVGVEDNTAHTLSLYVDGALASSITTVTTPQSYLGYWRIGSYMMYTGWTNSVAGYFPGSVDEARISTTARSAGWISTEYNNQNSPSTFTTLGTQQTLPTITSASSTTFTVGVAGSFTVTTTGTPTPSLTESGTLPAGVTFADNGNGTATLAGTPSNSTTANTYTLTFTATNSAGTATQSFTLTVNPGILSISVPASVSLGSAGPSGTISAQLGTVTVTDARYINSSSWTATVSTTTFTTGGQSSAETIPTTAVSYWSGNFTSKIGTGNFIPGQLTASNAMVLSTSRTAFAHTLGGLTSTLGFDPTLIIAVPAAAVAGTYTGTVTHSVA